jgi:hypothetical protein
MIFSLGIIFIFMGIMGLSMDLFVPVTTYEVAQMVGVGNLFGLMFALIGTIVIGIRMYQTGVGGFLDLPSGKRVILFHHRRGKNPNVSIMSGNLLDLEYIKSKEKIIKDTGGGFRIAGHDCRTTHETIAFDVPEWLMDYFYQVKKQYGVRNREEFIKLVNGVKNIHRPINGDKKLLEAELKRIPILQPIMRDEEKKEELLNLGYDRIKRLEIVCCDGMTHHHEEVEDFIESATPNELDTLVKQKYLNDRMKESNYRDPGSRFNYETLIPIAIGMFIAILGTIIFMSYIGQG